MADGGELGDFFAAQSGDASTRPQHGQSHLGGVHLVAPRPQEAPQGAGGVRATGHRHIVPAGRGSGEGPISSQVAASRGWNWPFPAAGRLGTLDVMSQSDSTTPTTQTDDPSAVVRQFLESWSGSKAAALASFDEFFTPETVWENVGLITTVGIEEAKALAENTPPGFETMLVDFKLIVAEGRYVFTERVDDFYNATGELLMSVRGAGVAEVEDGRIVAMREYFILTDGPAAPGAPATSD